MSAKRAAFRKIAIVRALLRRPPVLVLDEAFSFMDNDDIDRALALIPEGTITLLVSRNSAVIKKASRAFILRDGTLIPLTH